MEPHKPLHKGVFIEGVSPFIRNLVDAAYEAHAEFYDNLTRDLFANAKRGKIGGERISFTVPKGFDGYTFDKVMIKKFGMRVAFVEQVGVIQTWSLWVWG
ncbi:MAG: hypothetical protein E6R03_07900 [Hyphomicrobiaceae bacterium]|nr:MAG: hypothetical protein E6R03_07900 [Hyphomicrobiaceae bacterium]